MRRIDQIGGRIERIAFPDTDGRLFPAPGHFKIFDECPGEKRSIDLIIEGEDQK